MQMVTKESRVSILRSDKRDFKSKTVFRNKEGHYIMIKGSIHSEDIIPKMHTAKEIAKILYTKIDRTRRKFIY